MTKATRRWLSASLVLALVTLPAVFLTLSESGYIATTSGGPDQIAARWFKGLSADELVRAQANIQQLPSAQQLFVVRTLNPNAQSEFWRSHLRRQRAANRSLSAGAVAAINGVIEALSPELYADPAAFKAGRDAAVAHLKSAVDERTLDQLLHLPGEPIHGNTTTQRVLKSKVITWLRQHVVVSAQPSACYCVQEVDNCPDDQPCSGGGTSCNPAGTSCWYGWFAGWGGCYGVCGIPMRP